MSPFPTWNASPRASNPVMNARTPGSRATTRFVSGTWSSPRPDLERLLDTEVECVQPSLENEPRIINQVVRQGLGRLDGAEEGVCAALVLPMLGLA
jgi:hypothetical protein